MKIIFALLVVVASCVAIGIAAEVSPDRPTPGQAIAPEILAKGFHVHASPLSPFVLVRSDAPTLKLFQNLESIGGPTQVAFADDHKVKIVAPSTTIDPSSWTESWMLFWFTGGKGWDKLNGAPYPLDVPILVVLQHLPTRIAPAGTGVELTFPAEAGYVSIVPLYGSALFAASESAKWKGTLPDDVFKRCRMLAEMSREYPVSVEETFKIQPSQDKVLIRDRFEFFSIDDDFVTPHRKVAPLEPPVALAQKYGFRLFSTTSKLFDAELPTAQGPFVGVEADELSYTLTGLLRYVNQVEVGSTLVTSAERLPIRWFDGTFDEGDFTAIISHARRAYRDSDEDAYKFGCYGAAKRLTALWSVGTGWPKWSQDQKWPALPRLTISNPLPAQIRFMKDRMPDLAKGLPEVPQKTALLWKDGPWTPKPDWMFRMGTRQGGGGVNGSVFRLEQVSPDSVMLSWLSPKSAVLVCGISK